MSLEESKFGVLQKLVIKLLISKQNQMKYYSLLISFLWLGITSSGAQNVTGSFVHDGLTRNYTIYIPANYNAANAHPIVFNLHGYTSSGTAQASLTKMNAIADTAGFIVAYPEGTLDNSLQPYWNSGYGTGVDDIGFIDALIDKIAIDYTVDLQRVYSTGLSNGGIMSNTLACALNDRIAAIAGVGGTMSIVQNASCSPNNKIPVMHIHGTSDLVVSYLGNGVLLGVDALITHWRTHNGLTSTSSTTAFSNTTLLDGSTADLIRYETGSNYPVHLIRVNNGGHSWPGSGVIVSGSTNMDFDASLEIWKFFSQYSLLTSTSKIKGTEYSNWINLEGANPVQNELQWSTNIEENYSLTVYNLLGMPLLNQDFDDSKELTLKVNNLPAGAYLAVYTTNNKVQTLKFIKA
jgi:polyhydroxybutyrate depolymerase